MTRLARKLRTLDYFSLGFGSMVGAGWLVVMDDWLARGGPAGAMLGFAIGGLALLPIGWVYARLVEQMPDAGSEIAWTARVFPRPANYATGWMMVLAYLIVCPWETVAIGRMAAYIFPALHSFPLYSIAGQPVFLPELVLGLALAAVITVINYRGIRGSATFQNWTTFGLLALFALFASLGAARGGPANLAPLFSRAPIASILLTLQIVPYFMTGFESVPKCAEESSPEFRARGFSRAIFLALAVAILFYVAVIGVVAWVSPWKSLAGVSFPAAVAFERAFGRRWIVDVIFAAALLSLLKVFNGNFIAGSRLLFALGRAGLSSPRLARIHPQNATPSAAVLAAGISTALAALLGQAILVPISEVGSMASALGWCAACCAYIKMKPGARPAALAVLGALVAAALVLIKFLPFVPGHFTRWEFLALAVWAALGLALYRRARESA